jgi:hypothetical protein
MRFRDARKEFKVEAFYNRVRVTVPYCVGCRHGRDMNHMVMMMVPSMEFSYRKQRINGLLITS